MDLRQASLVAGATGACCVATGACCATTGVLLTVELTWEFAVRQKPSVTTQTLVVKLHHLDCSFIDSSLIDSSGGAG